jgi:hypothetical protein
MRYAIDVANRSEGDAVRRAIEDPTIKAAAVVTGILLELPDVEARRRVLHFAFLVLTDTNGSSPDLNTEIRLHDGAIPPPSLT